MKIIKYTKMDTNKYKVTLSNRENYVLYDDVIVKYELLRKKEFDDDFLNEILNYNNQLEAYYIAIKYIEKRLRTRLEVQQYLLKIYDKALVDKMIEKLSNDGYVNDKKYAELYINEQMNLTVNGPAKIRNSLSKLGISDEVITFYLAKLEKNLLRERINKYVLKKVRLNHKFSKAKLREKMVYELSNLGYENGDIYEVLDNIVFEEPDNLIAKEYEKYIMKLSKKYCGYDLEARVISKLLSKGFAYDEVKEVIANNRD